MTGSFNGRSRRAAAALVFAAVVGAFGLQGRGDEVLFNNGDRLTGTVLSADGGKLKIKTKVAGEVTVKLEDVKTFTTDEPIEVRTKSGQVMTGVATTQPAEEAAGTVAIAPSAAEGAPTTTPAIPLADIKYLNFNQKWTGSLVAGALFARVVAGALFARGNTYADQANIGFDAQRRTIDDRLTFTGQYNFGRERNPDTGDKTTSVDNFYLTGKYDYFLTEKFYLYGGIRYEHDRIALLDERVIPGIGVGYQWFETPDFKFDTEVGLAYVHEKFENGDTNDAMSGRLAYHLKKSFSDDKFQLFHDLEFYPSLERIDDFLVITDVGARATITEKMFAEYKIEYRYDATPAEGQDHTDLRHIIGVGWKF
jgi:putative salt-induced outer membrane protein YdiY